MGDNQLQLFLCVCGARFYTESEWWSSTFNKQEIIIMGGMHHVRMMTYYVRSNINEFESLCYNTCMDDIYASNKKI